MKQSNALNSCIYQGKVFHKRFSPKQHSFSYNLFFLAIDLDELPILSGLSKYFKVNRFAPLSFRCSDYLNHQQQISKADIWLKVQELGGDDLQGRVLFIGQMRCFGLYFSPINTYYCYDLDGKLAYLLAEVSNTPWNERHYYLIAIESEQICAKSFHVSPFMDLAMKYHWRINEPAEQLHLAIENYHQQKLFSASIAMKRQEFSNENLRNNLLSIPWMTAKTLLGIYWQALKLFCKGVPYIAHSTIPNAKKEKNNVS